MANEKWTERFFIAAPPLMNIFSKNLVRCGKSLERQRKWAQYQPPSSNRLKMVASQRTSYENTELQV
jgi:hypothetical protein